MVTDKPLKFLVEPVMASKLSCAFVLVLLAQTRYDCILKFYILQGARIMPVFLKYCVNCSLIYLSCVLSKLLLKIAKASGVSTYVDCLLLKIQCSAIVRQAHNQWVILLTNQ